jgi:hypothetical protein
MGDWYSLKVVQAEGGCWRLVVVQLVRSLERGSNPQLYIVKGQESDPNQMFNPTFLFISRKENQSICHCPDVHTSDDMIIGHTCTVHSLDRAAAGGVFLDGVR